MGTGGKNQAFEEKNRRQVLCVKRVRGRRHEAGRGSTGARDAGATLVTRPQPHHWQLGRRPRHPRGRVEHLPRRLEKRRKPASPSRGKDGRDQKRP